MGKNGNVIPLTGRQFGFLTVLARAGRIRKYAAWRCLCNCGNECVARSDKLLGGFKKSCGQGHIYYSNPTGGITVAHASEYSSWEHMRRRCRNKTHPKHKHYGARGIVVCERWQTFANFLADMGSKPTPEHTIERKDVNGNYEPENCRWATRKEQSRNMRRSVFINYEGKRQLLVDVANQIGMNPTVLYGRIKAMGWSVEDATTIPIYKYKKKKRS